MLLALIMGPLLELDVSNFCCMVCTCDDDEDELVFPLEAVFAPPGLEVLILELGDVVGLLELTVDVVVVAPAVVERKVDPVMEGFVTFEALAGILLLASAPEFLLANGGPVDLELADLDLAALAS